MGKLEEKLSKLTKEQVIKLFEESTSAYAVCKKLGYKNSNKSVWDRAEAIATECGFDLNNYYKPAKKFCLQCGKELYYPQKKFCSNSCAATYNNLRRPRKNSKILYCINCGKELHHPQKKFCSSSCQGELQYKTNVTNWLNGENKTVSNGLIPRYIRRYLMNLHNNKCEKCGWSQINPATGNVPLEVHHKDGDCFNNLLSNLELLCPNCHSITENYKALNKNSKREFVIVHKTAT